MQRTSHRLYWKLFAAYWVAMVVFFIAGFIFLSANHLPKPPGEMAPFPLIAAMVVSVMVSAFMARYITRPLQHLHWALDRVAGGHFDTRMRTRMGKRSDEITDLALHFDSMAERLQALTASRTVLLQDISHELRSPLSRLRAGIGLARQKPASSQELLERIDQEAQRLDELIEALMTLHRLEAGTPSLKTRVDIIELVSDIAEDAQFEAKSLNRLVKITAPGNFVASVDGELVYRAIENVIRNAIKFTAEKTTVEIEALVGSDGGLIISVCDRGPGLDESMMTRIFEPFFRADSAQAGTGSGLGLAIARRAIAAHGGEIKASARAGGGLVMHIHFPRSPAPEFPD